MLHDSFLDEYDAYNDFADLTEDDFALLDRVSSLPHREVLPQMTESGLPSVCIEVEGSHTSSQNADPTYKSPIRKYRKSGTLSVTDLISLAWCEVQFDYGLRQRRSRRLVDRPPSFQGASGKEIVVQQDVAAKNDRTTKRGRFIHKELELELRPEDVEEITIAITTEEEQWAVRLLNFLASLVCLSAQRCAREIPVFGVVQGVVVVGIIDEISFQCAEESGPETGTKRASDSPLPSPKRACRSPSPSCETQLSPAPAAPPPQYTLRVIDTKTRRTESLPSDEDAEPARLQVMLYRRLLTALLETFAPFDFAALFAHLNLDPSAPFSDGFLKQAGLLLADSPPACLEDAVMLLRTRIAELRLPAVDETLQIVYRSQNKYPRHRRRDRKGKGRETDSTSTREEDDIAKAIEMSLADAFKVDLANALKESALELGHDSTLVFIPGTHSDDSNLERVQALSTLDLSTILAGSGSPSVLNNERPEDIGVERHGTVIFNETTDPGSEDKSPVPAPEVVHNSEIIGTKEFINDDALLDAYLTSALQWWNGTRKAKGVAVRQTGRCFSCEYYNDCEWREQKAEELRQK
ncbi:exonuclease V [Mycena galericulata]|nr:exonuclease V [Mycena galericulata]